MEKKLPNVLHDLSNDMADVVRDVRRSLVHGHKGRNGAGAGSIWHPAV